MAARMEIAEPPVPEAPETPVEPPSLPDPEPDPAPDNNRLTRAA